MRRLWGGLGRIEKDWEGLRRKYFCLWIWTELNGVFWLDNNQFFHLSVRSLKSPIYLRVQTQKKTDKLILSDTSSCNGRKQNQIIHNYSYFSFIKIEHLFLWRTIICYICVIIWINPDKTSKSLYWIFFRNAKCGFIHKGPIIQW